MTKQSWITWCGRLIAVACIGFVGVQLFTLNSQIASLQFNWGFVGLISASVLIYLLGLLTLAYVWSAMVNALDNRQHTRTGIAIYARTQIAKYLPGNMFHFAGRHYLGRKAAYSGTSLMFASVYESVGLITVATLLGGGFLWKALNSQSVAVLIALPLLLLGGVYILKYLPRRIFRIPESTNLGVLGYGLLFRSMGVYGFFFAGTGLLLYFIYVTVDPQIDVADGFTFIGIYAAAWVAGYIVPGASGGVGVRETLIILLLAPYSDKTAALLSALSLRVVTTLADLIFYLLYARRRFD